MNRTLLRLLVRSRGDYLSGQHASDALGMTRAGVWKQITKLRELGFVIEAVPSRGYRLVSPPDLSPDYLLLCLEGGFWGNVIVHDRVDSTNEAAMSLCGEAVPQHGTVVIADSQSKGRGRLGRSWLSPPRKNVYLSMVLLPDLAPRDAPLLTLLAAVASAEAIRRQCNAPAAIKWPNDLMLGGKKVGGILTEMRTDPDRIRCSVIGIGLNVNARTGDFPPELREIATSLLIETGIRHDRNALVIEVLRSFEDWYRVLIAQGREPILAEWRRLASTLGKDVRVTFGEETIRGTAVDITDEGMLVLRRDDGTQRIVSAGDVTHLR